jgi:hypothetical protein
MAAALTWIWRILLLATVAYGVWGIWWQTVLLGEIEDRIVDLIDTIQLGAAPIE